MYFGLSSNRYLSIDIGETIILGELVKAILPSFSFLSQWGSIYKKIAMLPSGLCKYESQHILSINNSEDNNIR